MKITGRVWMFGDEINTDLIFPHSAFRADPEEQCRLCMSDNRPGWSALVQPGDILVAGKNFGTGSSRPGAAVLKRLGLAGILAESYNGLFFRNCIGYGLAALAVAGVTSLFREGDLADIAFDTGTVTNLETGECRRGSRLAPEMIELLECGGIEGVLKKRGYIRCEKASDVADGKS